MNKPNILVLCTGNSARSQMAEGLLRKHGGERFGVYSAGTDPKGINPLAVAAMQEIGIDISQQRSKHLNEYLGRVPIGILIIVCSDADHKCPAVWPGAFQRLFWPLEDPAAATGSPEEKLAKFREIRGQLEQHIIHWLKETRLS